MFITEAQVIQQRTVAGYSISSPTSIFSWASYQEYIARLLPVSCKFFMASPVISCIHYCMSDSCSPVSQSSLSPVHHSPVNPVNPELEVPSLSSCGVAENPVDFWGTSQKTNSTHDDHPSGVPTQAYSWISSFITPGATTLGRILHKHKLMSIMYSCSLNSYWVYSSLTILMSVAVRWKV